MIDQEIRDALNVDPSPEFVARVRTRIASEPEPSAWWGSWKLATVVALAAAVVSVVVVSRPPPQMLPVGPHETAGPQGPALQGVAQAPRQAEPSPSPAVGRPGPLGPGAPRSAKAFALHRARIVSGFSRTVAAAPDILLDPREARALQQLIAGVRDGRVDLAAAQRSTAPDPMALEPIAGLAIPLITIDPLTPSGEQGERQ